MKKLKNKILLSARGIAANEARKRQLIDNVPFPPEIFIETSNACNLRCKMCPTTYGIGRKTQNMEMELLKKIISQVEGYIPRVSLFLSGEPLLNKHIVEMIQYCSERDMYTRIHTNANLLTEGLSQNIIDAGLDEISFSFDGPTKQRHENIRVNSDFEKVLKNIKFFLNLKASKKISKPKALIQSIYYPGEDKDAIENGLAEVFKGYQYDKINVIPLHNFAGEITESACVSEETRSNEKIYTLCFHPYNRTTVYADGTVVACCIDFRGSLAVGNINESSILDIWNNSRMRHIRKILVEKRYKELPLCAKCDVPHEQTPPEVHRHPLLSPFIKQGVFRIVSWRDSKRR